MMKHICLVNLGSVINSVGGAEKILVWLANSLRQKGYDVTIVVSEDKSGMPFYRLDNNVLFYNIGENTKLPYYKKLLRSFFKLIHFDYGFILNKDIINSKLKGIFVAKKVDVIINFFPEDLKYVLKNTKNTIRVIQMLHGSDKWLLKRIVGKKRDVSILNRLNEVDCLQCLLDGYKKTLQKLIVAPISVIPNVVPKLPLCNYSKNIVYLARFDKDKQIHLLIEIFNIASKKDDNYQLHIYGMEHTKGYKQYCEELVSKYGLKNRCFLHNATSNIDEVLMNASICAFPSKYEAFPLGLTEAMSAGLACIGYKSCTGVNELIINGENGFLCDDGVYDFASKLSLLMNDLKLCKVMGQKGHESIKKYHQDAVIREWIKLIESL